MKEIKDLNVARLHTDEDLGFQKQVEAETAHLTLESDQQMVATYKAAISAFEDVIKPELANSNTAAVIAADKKADAAWRGLRRQVKAVIDYPLEAESTIAKKTLAIIDKYGDITEMSYNEEYGSMLRLLNELDALGSEAQKQIFISVWVSELHKYYTEFTAASAAQRAEKGTYITGQVQQVRNQADTAYRALIKRVNALAYTSNTPEDYYTFIDNVNVLVDGAKKTIATRKTRSDNQKIEE